MFDWNAIKADIEYCILPPTLSLDDYDLLGLKVALVNINPEATGADDFDPEVFEDVLQDNFIG